MDVKDMSNIYDTDVFDLITCNPPYFKYIESSNVNKNDYLTIARHEVKATLEDIIIESKKLLVDGGYLYMVHRCDRFSEICEVFTKNCFQIKTLRFVYSKLNSKEALFVLIEARKNRNPGTKTINRIYIAHYQYELNGKTGKYQVVSTSVEPPRTISLYYEKNSNKVFSNYGKKSNPLIALIYIIPILVAYFIMKMFGFN